MLEDDATGAAVETTEQALCENAALSRTTTPRGGVDDTGEFDFCAYPCLTNHAGQCGGRLQHPSKA